MLQLGQHGFESWLQDINENIGIFDFELTDREMQTMRSLNKETRFFNMTLPQMEEMVRNYPLAD